MRKKQIGREIMQKKKNYMYIILFLLFSYNKQIWLGKIKEGKKINRKCVNFYNHFIAKLKTYWKKKRNETK